MYNAASDLTGRVRSVQNLFQPECTLSARSGLLEKNKRKPQAAVLVHPESPAGVIAQADVVGSITRLIQAVKELPNKQFIVATDNGIFHKMSSLSGKKQLIEAPVLTCKHHTSILQHIDYRLLQDCHP